MEYFFIFLKKCAAFYNIFFLSSGLFSFSGPAFFGLEAKQNIPGKHLRYGPMELAL